jgi:hypothetical protein
MNDKPDRLLFCTLPALILSAACLLPYLSKALTIDDPVFMLQAHFAPVAVKRVPLFAHEVLGQQRLEELAAVLYAAGEDPSAITRTEKLGRTTPSRNAENPGKKPRSCYLHGILALGDRRNGRVRIRFLARAVASRFQIQSNRRGNAAADGDI